jgi:pimeloyl-ACP methyl ester carboxylesterase
MDVVLERGTKRMFRMRSNKHSIGLLTAIAFVSLSAIATTLRSDEPGEGKSAKSPPDRSWGALDHWCDQLVYSDWRIQTNVVTQRCRLLNDNGDRVCTGDYATCRAFFDRERSVGKIPAMKPDVVICLHGLARSRDSMQGLVERFNETGEFSAISFGYASMSANIDEHASALAKTIEALDGAERIHFVAHSMGNIVIRRMMAKQIDCHGKIDPRFGRMVMLGPPNQGSVLAKAFGSGKFLGLVLGPAAQQLGPQWEQTELQLVTPPIEFAIIAGGMSTGGYSPVLTGDDDFIVRVAETKLPGAADYRVLPVHHAGVRSAKHVGDMTLCFVKNGYLESPETQQSIAADGRLVKNTASKTSKETASKDTIGPTADVAR